MTAITNYNSLIAAVSSLAEDVGQELAAFLPTAIDTAENRMSRELDFLGLDYISPSIPVPSGTMSVPKPQGHKLTYFVKTVSPSGVENILEHKQDDYLTEYIAGSSPSGTPKY